MHVFFIMSVIPSIALLWSTIVCKLMTVDLDLFETQDLRIKIAVSIPQRKLEIIAIPKTLWKLKASDHNRLLQESHIKGRKFKFLSLVLSQRLEMMNYVLPLYGRTSYKHTQTLTLILENTHCVTSLWGKYPRPDFGPRSGVLPPNSSPIYTEDTSVIIGTEGSMICTSIIQYPVEVERMMCRRHTRYYLTRSHYSVLPVLFILERKIISLFLTSTIFKC